MRCTQLRVLACQSVGSVSQPLAPCWMAPPMPRCAQLLQASLLSLAACSWVRQISFPSAPASRFGSVVVLLLLLLLSGLALPKSPSVSSCLPNLSSSRLSSSAQSSSVACLLACLSPASPRLAFPLLHSCRV